MIKKIESKNNKFIISLAKLVDKKERNLRKEYLIEGLHLVDEAYKEQVLECVIGINEAELNKYDVDKILVTEEVIKKLTTTINSQNIIGLVKMKDYSFSKQKKIVILDDIQDPGNLGTIIRTAAALGYDAVVTSNNSVDFYNDKTIRSSQGSIFKIDLIKLDLIPFIKKLKELDYKVYGTSLKNGVNLKNITSSEKIALIFGNEAHGVRDEILNLTTKNIYIEMQNRVESLNVAVTSAIILYELNK